MNTSGTNMRRGIERCGTAAHLRDWSRRYARRFPRRRGAILLYSVYLMMMMCAVTSLAVDYGRIQMIKTQLQRAADATARAALEIYLTNGNSKTSAKSSASTMLGTETIDEYSGVTPTSSITWGYWQSGAFVSGTSATYPLAVRVVVQRTTANGNPVHLLFPIPTSSSFFSKTCDVQATSIAILPNVITQNVTVPATYDPWLAGMPNGSTASYDDAAPAESPASITVTPGSTITFTNVNGLINHTPSTPTDGPEGQTGNIYWHMKDPPSGAQAVGQGAQNHIGDIIVPIDSLLGVFLNANAPTSNPTPTVVRDYSTQTARDQASFTDIQVQQPFFIGSGNTSSGTTQTFVAPTGATRLFLGPMDGYEWENNNGSFTATLTIQPPIQLVQ
jgi:plastocyanin/Flp pilus assembly protein TadG